MKSALCFVVGILIALVVAREAQAACTSPDGSAGAVTWNGTDAVIWCDGSDWHSLADNGGGGALSGGTSGYLGVWSGATTMGLSSTTTGQQLFWDGTNNRLGIGTSTPASKLHIVGLETIRSQSDDSNIAFYNNSNVRIGYLRGIAPDMTLVTDNGNVTIGAQGGTSVLSMQTNSLERMRITSGGNVGIGTTTAGSKLDVVGTIRGTQISSVGSTGTDLLTVRPGDDLNPTYNAITLGNAGWTAWPFAVRKNGSVFSSGTLSVDGTGSSYVMGNVGIGTTTPDYKLTIQSSDAAISLKDGSGTTRGYIGVAGIDGSAPANSLRLRGDSGIVFSVAGFPGVTIDSSRNVGIGTTSPGYKVDVAGAINTSGGVRITSISTSGSVTICRDGTAYLTLCSSDRRLKKDITSLGGDALSIVSKLRPVSFTWKADETHKQDAGFIAQDVLPLIPEAIGENSSDGMLTLNINPIVAYSVKAIQELKADNDNLRAELKAANDNEASQNAAIDALRNEIDALKAAR